MFVFVSVCSDLTELWLRAMFGANCDNKALRKKKVIYFNKSPDLPVLSTGCSVNYISKDGSSFTTLCSFSLCISNSGNKKNLNISVKSSTLGRSR